ncbi:hypothetical protein GCM10009551_034120 [Nocardiopsis tropica]
MAAQPQGAVHEHGPGLGERGGQEFDDPVEHDRYVQRVRPGAGRGDAVPDAASPPGSVPGVLVFAGRAVPFGLLVLPGVPHAVLFLHAFAVSPWSPR